MFTGITKMNKEKGLGEIESNPPIEAPDMAKLTNYFKQNLTGPPNAMILLKTVVFYIIYYLCRRGRENLREMTVNTFPIALDPTNNLEYVYQKVDKADKNHGHNDTNKANQGVVFDM